jgi:hypothetical protein
MQYQKKATFAFWTSLTSTKEMNQGNALGVFQLGRARGPALISGAIPTLERMSAGPDREGRKGKLFRRRLQPKQAGALGMSAAQKTNSSRPVWRIVRASDGGLGPGQVCKQGATLPVHLIYHVPRCAGQTIDRHFAAALSANAYHRIRRRRGFGRLLFTRHDFGKMPDPNQTRVVGGHFLGISVEPLFAGRELKRSILLRDPVSHFISYYNFRMMRYLSQGLHPYSFELAYRATQRNFITHYILRNFLELPWSRLARFSDDEKYDIVNAFLVTFWYVGNYGSATTWSLL